MTGHGESGDDLTLIGPRPPLPHQPLWIGLVAVVVLMAAACGVGRLLWDDRDPDDLSVDSTVEILHAGPPEQQLLAVQKAQSDVLAIVLALQSASARGHEDATRALETIRRRLGN